MTEKKLTFSKNIFIIPLLFISTIWFIFWVEIIFGFNFNKFGVFPRTVKGLRGVLFSPFIHSNAKHLFNNSAPLFVLMSSLLFFYKEVATKVLLLGGLLTGVLTWVIARESYHIGASGIVYLLFSFIFFSGIIKKHYRLVTLSLIVIFLYGSMIWYIFPIEKRISWEGHLSGFVAGLLFAYIYKEKGIIRKKYKFKKTSFDDMFDEHGNYIPPEPEKDNEHSEEPNEQKPKIKLIRYKYFYKEKD